jgi:L-lysine 2,3-aminomutase
MRESDVHQLFDDLEQRGHRLREVILSGGDPLSAPPDILALLGERMQRLRELMGGESPHLTVHTREPVWDPIRLMENRALWPALKRLRAKTFMINVLHPREVTPEFKEVCARLAGAAGAAYLAALFSQHPLFRGVNDSEEILEDLYLKLLTCSPPVIPYYIVHPFYNGTLPKHRLSLESSQEIYRSLLRRPGVLVPRLVVPTPWGKCVLGPNEPLRRTADGYELVTKDGRTVILA